VHTRTYRPSPDRRSALRMNSLCIRSCKPTAHCNKSRDPVDQPKTLCLHRKLRPALEHPADFTRDTCTVKWLWLVQVTLTWSTWYLSLSSAAPSNLSSRASQAGGGTRCVVAHHTGWKYWSKGTSASSQQRMSHGDG